VSEEDTKHPDQLPRYDEPVCELCGVPIPQSGHSWLVLYFKDPADAENFVEVVKTALPGLSGFQAGQLH